jgi:hypothetical protein
MFIRVIRRQKITGVLQFVSDKTEQQKTNWIMSTDYGEENHEELKINSHSPLGPISRQSERFWLKKPRYHIRFID